MPIFFYTPKVVLHNLIITLKTTLAWQYPLQINHIPFVIEGFADFAGDEGINKEPHQLIVPRFLLDLGHLNGNPNKFFAGIEWQYWHNKFGIIGVTESVAQLQLKYLF